MATRAVGTGDRAMPGEPPCANCGAAAPGAFCPQCGQETIEPPAIADFFHGSLFQ